MIDIVPKDSRYIPLNQQKWCCVPTCIQMVMLRHGIPLIPAELIGYHMGLVVPDDANRYFWNARTGPRPPTGYGTQVDKPQYGPNAVFKKLNIPFQMRWSLIHKFKTLGQFHDYLIKLEKIDKDVLVCFDWPTLFDSNRTEHWGHVCVLDKIFIKHNTVRIIDPDPKAPKWREVTVENLYTSMLFHTKEKSGGFWEIKKTIK